MGLFSRSEHSDGLTEQQAKEFNEDIKIFQDELTEKKDYEEEFSKLGKIVNAIFNKGVGLHYKLTYEDLKFETKEKNLPQDVQRNVEDVCDVMNDMEFHKDKITKEKLMVASNKASELVSTLSGLDVPKTSKTQEESDDRMKELMSKLDINENVQEEKQEQEKKGFFSKIFKKDKKELPSFEGKEDVVEVKESDDNKIEIPEPPAIKLDADDKTEEIPEFTVSEKKEEIKVKKPKEKRKKKVKHKPTENKKIVKTKKKVKKKVTTFIEDEPKKDITKVEKPKKIKTKPKKIKKSKKKKKVKKKTKSKVKKNSKKSKAKKVKTKKAKVTPKKLPMFKVPKSFLKKQKQFKKNLSDIVKDLEKNKKEISDEIGLLDEESKLLKKEKKLIKNLKGKKLPEFKTFGIGLDKHLKDIEKKKKELEEKEKEVEDRLEQVKEMEKKQKQLSKQLGKDEEAIKERQKFLEAKDKVLKRIKKDLDKTYKNALKEIEDVRKDLKEKEDNFLKLQKFYKLRENKLAVEEENLMNAKRQYTKIFSGLLANHMSVALRELEDLEKRIQKAKETENEIDDEFENYEKKFKELVKQKDEIKEEIEEKKEYFEKTEEEFKSKDPEFEKLRERIKKKNKELRERETALLEFEKRIKESENSLRQKKQELDLKDVDLKAIEKDIERLTFDLKNNNLRLDMREKQLEKRISSYDMLKQDIDRHIRREKRAIKRIEEKLEKKGYKVDKKLEKTEKEESKLHLKSKTIFDMEHKEPIHHREIKVTHHFESEPGNPTILDILRLLNRAEDFISNNRQARARDTYLEIQRLFEQLEEEERESIYPEIINVFKPRDTPTFTQGTPETFHSSGNIDQLLEKFENTVLSGDLKASETLYSMLQQEYVNLPEQQKAKYYSRIMDLYNKVLEHQVQTGAVS